MSEVKLFGTWFSPFVKRVEVALKLKGVEYEYIEEDLTKKSPLFLHYNPIQQKVPVLVHNGKAIVESMVILEYIDEVFEGPSILPKDHYDRAMARFWAKLIEEKCSARKVCWSGGEEQEKAKKEAEEALKILDNEIKGKKFFGGDKIGIVDLAANSLAFWFQIIQEEAGLQILTKEKFPNLWKWGEEFCNDSFVKEVMPSRKKMGLGFKKAMETGNLYHSLSLVHATFVEEIDKYFVNGRRLGNKFVICILIMCASLFLIKKLID